MKLRLVSPSNRSRTTLSVATSFLIAAVAPAVGVADEHGQGWYIGVNVPFMSVDDTASDVSGTSTLGTNTVPYSNTSITKYGSGMQLGLLLGYHVQPGLRFEGELFYGSAKVKEFDNSNFTIGGAANSTLEVKVAASGNAKILGGMANAWYDLPLDWEWNPFLGGGLGMVSVDFSDVKWDNDVVAKAVAEAVSPGSSAAIQPGHAVRPADKDTVMAYQIGAGLGYQVTDWTTIQVSYKYRVAPGITVEGKNATSTVKSETDIKVHLFEVGLRYDF